MPCKTIDTLPEEVLLHIFEFLSGNALMQALVVDKRWNATITTSPRTMKKIVLILPFRGEATKKPDVNKILKIERNITAIRTNDTSCVPLLSAFLKARGSVITSLDLRGVTIEKFHLLLKNVPNLENLRMFSCVLTSMGPVELQKLKVLELYDSDYEILDFITTTSKLSDVTFDRGQEHGLERKRVVDFLIKCPSLIKLQLSELTSQHHSPFFVNDIANLPCKLKSFSLKQQAQYVPEIEENIIKFLALHEDSMEQLQMLYGHAGTSALHQQLFTGFKNMRSLHVDLERLPLYESETFWMCLEPLESVKELTLSGGPTKHSVAKAFFGLFPSLESLDMCSTSTKCKWLPNLMKKLPSYHKNLKHLSFPTVYAGTPPNLHFKNLQSLTVSKIESTKAWLNFVASHRQLESIKVLQPVVLSEDDVKLILELPTLRNIEFLGIREQLKMIFDIVKVNYKNLHTATFNTGISKAGHLTIYFPFERKAWKPKQYEHFFAVV